MKFEVGDLIEWFGFKGKPTGRIVVLGTIGDQYKLYWVTFSYARPSGLQATQDVDRCCRLIS